MSFWCFEFFQKTNENNSTGGIIVVKSNFFVHFLEELKTPKIHFEIDRPLARKFLNDWFMNISQKPFQNQDK